MRRLLIDRGNTRIKVAIVNARNEKITESRVLYSLGELHDYIKFNSEIGKAIYSDVQKDSLGIEELLSKNGISFVRCNHLIELPFKLDYNSPESLGDDRIAGVAAAFFAYPNKNVIVIDSGTCITYDFIDKKAIYHGGAISPGIKMRFKVLHKMTDGLPLVEFEDEESEFPGKNTIQSIKAGVLKGILNEANSFIETLSNKHGELIVLIGGGDRKYFETNLKGNIFAAENLILEGLNGILSFHDSQ